MNKLRKYVSILLVYAFIVVAFTGIVLFIAPHGRVANWTNWKILGMTKDQYEDVHTIFGYLMIILSIIHIYLNWNAMKFYLKNKTKLKVSKEFLISTLIAILIFIGTILYIPPFSTIMDRGELMKNKWERNKKDTPPIPHAENMAIDELSKYMNMSADEIVDILKSKGIKGIAEDKTFGEIAEENGMSPNDLYNLLESNASNTSDTYQYEENDTYRGNGGGYGQMTIEDLCSREGIEIQKALDRLEEKGIDASVSSNIRDLADKSGLRPREIYDIILSAK